MNAKRIVNRIIAAGLIGMLSISVVRPKPSQAAILAPVGGGIGWLIGGSAGLSLGAAIGAIIGGATFVTGSVYGAIDCIAQGSGPCTEDAAFALASFLMGVMVLDQNATPVLQLQALDPASAAKIGVSPEDVGVYNQELDEVNAILQDVTAQSLAQASQPGMTKEALTDFGHSVWTSESAALSPETRATVLAILTQSSKSI